MSITIVISINVSLIVMIYTFSEVSHFNKTKIKHKPFRNFNKLY